MKPNEDAAYFIRKFIAGGAAGAAGMSAVELMRAARAAERDAKARRAAKDTDKDTIVLTLPKKTAGVLPTVTKTAPKLQTLMLTAAGQMRHGDGKLGKKLDKAAQAPNMWDAAGGALAFGGGALGGINLIDKLYAWHRKRELERQVEAAKAEYLDMLAGGAPKTAAAEQLVDIFSLPATEEKSAAIGDKKPDVLTNVAASMALLGVLGTAGTTWLTKRILDERFKDVDRAGLDIPKLNRIVIRTAAGNEEEITPNEAKVAMALAMQAHKGDVEPLNDPDTKMKLAEVGWTPQEMLKQAQINTADAISFMRKRSPALLNHLYTKLAPSQGGLIGGFASKYPGAFSKALALPGLGTLSDKMVSHSLNKRLSGVNVPMALAHGMYSVPAALGNVVSGWFKGAAAPTGKVGPLVAAVLAGDLLSPGTTDIAEAVAAKQEADKAKKQMLLQRGRVRVDAADPNALAFALKNRDRIQSTLQQMATAGKV